MLLTIFLSIVFCAAMAMMLISAVAFIQDNKFFSSAPKEAREVLIQREQELFYGARAIGWNIPDSKGSMFVWAPIPEGYTRSMDFCLDLMEKASVLCTPGVSFGPHGEGYVRFALVLPEKEIAEALESIRQSGILDR